MKPLMKNEKSSSSTSEELATQRPKRSTSQKNTDVSNGLLWREETDLTKALYASLQETRKKNFDDDDEDFEEEETSDKHASTKEKENEQEQDRMKKAKVHAQRKFAQGSSPTSPVPTPQKVPNHTSATELLPYRRPKTEDFLTFLCLRGTTILPPSLDFLNCSKSDTSSECRSLSPELEIRDYSNSTLKASEPREKVSNKHEIVPNGQLKKNITCKVSSKRHLDVPLPVKKTFIKSQKEVSVVRKRKSRDESDSEFLPSKTSVNIVSSNNRTRSASLSALKEKYKKQRLASGKKNLSSKTLNIPVSLDVKTSTSKPLSVHSKSKKSLDAPTRTKSKMLTVKVSKLKSRTKDNKLALEKRKSLRSAHISKGFVAKKGLNKKTMWLRRAKLVPPIVDVDSDSEPEIINTVLDKSVQLSKVSSKQECFDKSTKSIRNDNAEKLKSKTTLTSRQILLRKHMQNRLKAKKSTLHVKNVKSKVISKKSIVKQEILKKMKKSIGLKTMSLRKDLQNKRVTRSAKHQIEDMFFKNPEKRTRVQNSKTALFSKSIKRPALPEKTEKKPKIDSPKIKSNKKMEENEKSTKSKLHSNINNNKPPRQHILKEKEISDNVKIPKQVSNVSSIEIKSPQYNIISSKAKSSINCVPLIVTKTSPNNSNSVKEKSSLKSKMDNKNKSLLIKSANEINKNKIKKDVLNSKLYTNLKSEKELHIGGVKEEKSKGESTKMNSKCSYVGNLPDNENKILRENSKQVIETSSSKKEKSKQVTETSSLKKEKSKHVMVTSFSKKENSKQVTEAIPSKKESSKNKFQPSKQDISNTELNKGLDDKCCKGKEEAVLQVNKSALNLTIRDLNQHCDVQLNEKDKGKSAEIINTEKVCNQNTTFVNSITSQITCNNDSNEFQELNVKNNLNLIKIDKTSDKDISKLITLSVEKQNVLKTVTSEPSSSGMNKKDKSFGAIQSKKKCGNLLSKSETFKKPSKRHFKKLYVLKEVKSRKRNVDKNKKSQSKIIGKALKKSSIEKTKMVSKKQISKSADKSTSKKESNFIKTHDVELSAQLMSNSANNDKMGNLAQNILTNLEKFQNKCQNKVDTSEFLNSKDLNEEICPRKILNVKKIGTAVENLVSDLDNSDIQSNSIQTKNQLKSNEKINNCNKKTDVLSDDDDDSDSDLTVHQYLKLTSHIDSAKLNLSLVSSKSGKNHDINALKSKNIKPSKKEIDKASHKDMKENNKESLKYKKDGIPSKHKKDSSKSKNYDKTFKKEEKYKKDKSLKKEKERSKSSKKDDKSKYKKEGSCSSKSSKKDSDKDGSKLRRESEKDNYLLEKPNDKKLEFVEIKKDKLSKKESSKLSRSNSYDETKSPKKKKKYNEFKDIEKIKDMISYSSILSEISGFKSFKRRISNDKSDVKKRLSKKKKKLALLKEKKLSKKISSKLLRKYSKKKGLKSKKNKLKKKELKKEMKASNLSKVKKKQKHKIKDHHRKENQEKIINGHVTSFTLRKANTLKVPIDIYEFEDSNQNESLQNTAVNFSSVLLNTNAISINDKSTSANFSTENMSKVNHSVQSTHISADFSQSMNLLFNSEKKSTVVDETICSLDSLQNSSVLSVNDGISQVPIQFMPDTPTKMVADAATNTCEEDIDEVLSAASGSLRSEEMSVGTQTITPAASPSPTLEVLSQHSFLTTQSESSLANKSNNLPISSISSCNDNQVSLSTNTSNNVKHITTILESLPSTSPLPSNIILSGTIESLDTMQALKADKKSTPITLIVPVPVSEATSSKLDLQSPLASAAAAVTPAKSKFISQKNTKPSYTISFNNVKKLKSINKADMPSKIKKRTTSFAKSKITSINFMKSESFPLNKPKIISAPVYYPSPEEFQDPLEYISKIYPEAEQYGICKIIPPSTFKPECKVNDDLRFMALNQYLHKMLYRWGPNVQHTACIKKHLKSQKVELEQAPLIGGIELDISRFYHTVQQFGGLQQVIIRKMWQKVADMMHIPKAAQDRVTKLYNAYCKYLVSYDTLPSEEKQKLEDEVISEHNKYIKFRNSKDSEKEDDLEEEENPECVTKGQSMPLSNFCRIARNTMSMYFKNDRPLPEEVEQEFWKIVTERKKHVVVHAGNIDSNTSQSGFPSNKTPFGKHPWNLKVLTNNQQSILRCMGPVSGITSPTLHVGMLFTTSCWYRDPHSLPWIEYLHTGASKIWYGIPAKSSEKFKNAMKKIVPEYCTDKPLWLSSESSMVPPNLLVKNGSSLSRTIQKSGQFVIIFPESFTSTICCGYCVSESVYFAPTSWLDLAEKAFQDIQSSCESPAFSLERLLLSIPSDPKPQLEALTKILPIIENIKSKEMKLRAQLSLHGLKDFERVPISEPQEKKRKSKQPVNESAPECEICSTPCYLSRVSFPQEDTIYCLADALESIQKKNLKNCKLQFTYDQKDFEDNIKKIHNLTSEISNSDKKKSPKKKPSSTTEK